MSSCRNNLATDFSFTLTILTSQLTGPGLSTLNKADCLPHMGEPHRNQLKAWAEQRAQFILVRSNFPAKALGLLQQQHLCLLVQETDSWAHIVILKVSLLESYVPVLSIWSQTHHTSRGQFNIYVCLCMCIYIYVCVHVCMHIWIYVCRDGWTVRVYVYVCAFVHMCIYICILSLLSLWRILINIKSISESHYLGAPVFGSCIQWALR